MQEEFVRLAKCRMCGSDTGAILMNMRLKSIPEEAAWDIEPCPSCKERLKTMIFFIGGCGHCGFVREEAFMRLVTCQAGRDKVLARRICRMERCFVCHSGQRVEEFPRV